MGRVGEPPPPVLVQPSCFLGLVNSAIEVYNRETTGLLVGEERVRTLGRRRRRVMVLQAAFPIQTAARSVTWVEHGNHRAVTRSRTSIDSLGYRITGEFHSHTNNEHALSKADVEYARQAIARMNGHAPKRWLEVVMGLRRKSYRSPRVPGFTWRDYPRKVGCTVVLSPRTGFDVTLAGYWIHPNGRGMKCEEAEMHVPFDKRTVS